MTTALTRHDPTDPPALDAEYDVLEERGTRTTKHRFSAPTEAAARAQAERWAATVHGRYDATWQTFHEPGGCRIVVHLVEQRHPSYPQRALRLNWPVQAGPLAPGWADGLAGALKEAS